ncbi:hypothetical protein V1520DRAFT_311228 [Lipomyces starkeyi]|uniref:Uncharacterized protein n=1 Tax=Lipomyces starkeyi NRRL Y-11557 TaxID=675824 RepID=A0A1E3PUF3_LIPST|nr:hypothetical protein LIPSTDRAFT_114409 [Lipomyces starkeyi NRRL Y-11557]
MPPNKSPVSNKLSQKYVNDDVEWDCPAGASSQRLFSKLGYFTIAIVISSLLSGLIGAVIVVHVTSPGTVQLWDPSGRKFLRDISDIRHWTPAANASTDVNTATSTDSMQKRALIDESILQPLLNATAIVEGLLESLLPTLIASTNTGTDNGTLVAGGEKIAAAVPGIMRLLVKKSVMTRTLDGAVLQILLNATAIAEDLLQSVLPALITRTNTTTNHETLVNGGEEKVGAISDAMGAVGKDSIIPRTIDETVLQTLLNAAAIAEELLESVLSTLVAHKTITIDNRTFADA